MKNTSQMTQQSNNPFLFSDHTGVLIRDQLMIFLVVLFDKELVNDILDAHF
jgi:hypothetical protein